MGLSGKLQKPNMGIVATLPGKLVFGIPGPKGDPGLSDTAKVLLISILQEANYRTNQSANIYALALELGIELNESTTATLGIAVLGEMILGG